MATTNITRHTYKPQYILAPPLDPEENRSSYESKAKVEKQRIL